MNSRFFATLGSLTLLATGAAFAQNNTIVTANVPFEFHVGSTVIPPGPCKIEIKADSGVLFLRCRDSKNGVIALSNGVQSTAAASEKGSMVFNRYGDSYFLARLWTPGTATGRELLRSKVEREWAKTMSEVPTVTVALSRP